MLTWLEAGGALVTHTSAQGPRGLQILVTQGLLHSPMYFGGHSLHCLPNQGFQTAFLPVPEFWEYHLLASKGFGSSYLGQRLVKGHWSELPSPPTHTSGL